jgi:adenosylhomocysteine nucleosidase
MNVVVLISAGSEWRAVKELYPNLEIQHSPYGEFSEITLDVKHLTLFHGGWGKISAAATAQYAIDHFQPDLLVNLGTCGGFAGRVETGEIILVERTLVYDIIEQMGDSAKAIRHYTSDLDLSWLPANLPFPTRRSLLVSADRDLIAHEIPLLIEKYNAIAADWESGAIAWVAQKNKTPLLILRGVTDLVDSLGGEAYGNIELFHQRAKMIMRQLMKQLPDWLQAIKSNSKLPHA